jgi:photosystem II stability/assembly factor-like uncharacterized protein
MLVVVVACSGIAALLLVARSGHVGGGSPAPASSAGSSAARPPAAQIPPPIGTGADRWLAYRTAANPGGGIQFVSPQVGFALSGEPQNIIDGQLSAGPGPILAWPSPTLLVTRDGGRSFTPSLTAAGGFWGLDFSDAQHGWAVGVTALYRTVDGGIRWMRAHEPRTPLLRVAFADSTSGFGLTLNGRLVTTTDGGASWTSTTWSGRGSALCMPTLGEALVADQSGGIWRTRDGGATWSRTAPGLAHVLEFTDWWPDLSCQGTNVVEPAQALCAAACGGGVITRIRQSSDGGLHWHQLLLQANGPNGVTNTPRPGLSQEITRAIAVGADGVCLLGSGGASVAIRCLPLGANANRDATVPRLPFRNSASTTAVLGGDFINATTGWVSIAEATPAATLRQARAQTVVWTTDDAGRSWREVYGGPTHHL